MKAAFSISAILLLACAGSASAQTVGFAVAASDVAYLGVDPGTTTGVLGETFVAAGPDGGTADGVTLTIPFVQTADGSVQTLDQGGIAPSVPNTAPFPVAPYLDGDVFESDYDFTVTISGLTKGEKYDVVAYESGYATTFNFSGSAGTQTISSDTAPLFIGSTSDEVAGVNYVESVETANASGEIVFSATPADDSLPPGPVGLLEGVGISPAETVPEPSTWALLAGGLALFAFRSKGLPRVRRLISFSKA